MSDLDAPAPKGIGGWLVLVVIGLVVHPMLVGYFLMTAHWPLFRDGLWPVLTTPGTEAYHPLLAPLIIFEVVGNVVSMTLAFVTLWFLFRRSRHTPQLAIAWLIWGAAIVVIDNLVADRIPAIAAQQDTEGARELVRSIVNAAIWVPYFMVSRRVRATFVE